MVAHLVRLRLTLLRNSLRRSAWQVVALVVGLLYGLGLLLLAGAGLVALAVDGDTTTAGTALVLLGGLLVLGWCVVPLIAFGVDATLDPSRFATFAIPQRPLLLGLALCGLLGVPGMVTALLSLASAAVWWRSPPAVVAGVVGAVLAVATCIVASRAVTTALASLVTGRRFREVAAGAAFIPLVLLGPLLNAMDVGVRAWWDALPSLARVVAWTPFGAAWALPADVAEGRWAQAGARLLIAVVTLGALVALWDRSLRGALTGAHVSRPGPRSKVRGLGAFGRFPATPVGAVAARCVTYWLRDPRYASSLAVLPLVPFILAFVGGSGSAMLILGPVAAYAFGWGISTDVAFDSTAFWMHVGSPVRGVVDRWGRVCGSAVLGVPAVLVFVLVSLVVTGRWDLTVPLLGLSLGTLASAFGVASVVSTLVVYPVPQPGESPFKTPKGGQMAVFVSQAAGGLVLLVLVAPTAALTIAAGVTGSAALGWLTLVVGLALGGALLLVGVRRGGAVYDRRAPELLAQLRSFD